MSIRYYDDALLEKLKFWGTRDNENTSLHIYGPNDTQRLFEVLADESDDKPINLPIICLRRNAGFRIQNINMDQRDQL